MAERIFDTLNGSVRVKLFEGKVGWNIPNNAPNLFAWGLSGWKFDRLHLTETEQIRLNQEYLEWSASVGCGGCKLLGNTCSGLQQKPFDHFADGKPIIVNSFEANFSDGSVKDKSYDEIRRVIKRDANCKPKSW